MLVMLSNGQRLSMLTMLSIDQGLSLLAMLSTDQGLSLLLAMMSIYQGLFAGHAVSRPRIIYGGHAVN
jgi:hypothetical protein